MNESEYDWVCDWCGRSWKRKPKKPCAICERDEKGLGKVFYTHTESYFVFVNGKLVLDRVCNANTHKILWDRKRGNVL